MSEQMVVATIVRRCALAVGAALMVLSSLALVPVAQAPAQAVDEWCTLGADGLSDCVEPSAETEPGSSTLLTPQAYATMSPEQAMLFRRLEDQAVSLTMELYQLPAGDARYVSAWARQATLGVLRKLVFKAVDTLPWERTPDERLVAAWIGDQVAKRMRAARYQEGEEYARWAGLDVAHYWDLVHGGASVSALTEFLAQRPVDMNGATPATSTGGYCIYRPPAGFTDYNPDTLQICHAPCQSGFSCAPEPTVEQFVAWGAARADAYTKMDDPDFTVRMGEVVMGAAEAGGLAVDLWAMKTAQNTDHFGEIVRRLNGRREFLVSMREGITATEAQIYKAYQGMDYDFVSALQRAIRSAAKAPLSQVRMIIESAMALPTLDATKGESYAVSKVVRAVTTKVIDTLLDNLATKGVGLFKVVASYAQKLAGAVTGWSADILLFNLDALVQASMNLDAAIKRPGQIAAHVVYARDFKHDAERWTALGMRHLVLFEFMDAVAPTPAARPIRPPAALDPQFLIRDLDGSSRSQSSSLGLGRNFEDVWTPVTLRVSGRWAVEKWIDPVVGVDTQGLELRYTSHDLQPEVAYLVPHADGRYSFFVMATERAGFNRETCKEDGTCWESDELRYLDGAGLPKIARLEVPRPATGDVQVSTTAPSPGLAVTFAGGSFAPGGAQGMLTYRWRFQREGCAGITGCVTWYDGRQVPLYDPAVSGFTASRAWTEPGTYQVEVTVTDAMGRKAVKTIAMEVGG
jgi:hypothetical protein